MLEPHLHRRRCPAVKRGNYGSHGLTRIKLRADSGHPWSGKRHHFFMPESDRDPPRPSGGVDQGRNERHQAVSITRVLLRVIRVIRGSEHVYWWP